MPVILAIHEAERGSWSKSSQANSSQDPILKKTHHKKKKKEELAEWLKVKALSSNPSTEKNRTGNKARNVASDLPQLRAASTQQAQDSKTG
jgi:hypothetical protein